MDQCWEQDPEKRPDIFTVVGSLRALLHNITGSSDESLLKFNVTKYEDDDFVADAALDNSEEEGKDADDDDEDDDEDDDDEESSMDSL